MKIRILTTLIFLLISCTKEKPLQIEINKPPLIEVGTYTGKIGYYFHRTPEDSVYK